ncbi:hypothetical protein A2U01_0048377 [Trifolium medium]|uniref:Uncharacterized protein n=1 Tax=Trifolium medium TaxID=97028 RepID=A0A392QT65_9FABA|nr:hypothetical protein [Trifolium medium]
MATSSQLNNDGHRDDITSSPSREYDTVLSPVHKTTCRCRKTLPTILEM